MLFADVSGSMDLAEQQDPEEWRKIMQRFFSILADAVTRFEGTVDKFTGDGIMAVFGAPIAHEDHAQRACYAALQMLDDVAEYAAELRRGPGLNFSTRIGINSGEVVAGAIGSGGDGDYTAIGHTVGLAQRMEALAEPGKAYLTEHTAELAAGFLDLDDLGEFEIKGASRPVRVFELAGVGAARSRLDLARERGFSRFVGRGEEMDDAASRRWSGPTAGDGGAVGIVAEPGRRQEPPLPRVRRALPRARASRSSRRRPRRTARRSRSCRCCRCCAPSSGSATRDPDQQVAREDRRPGAAARPRASPTTCRCCSTSSASPTPTGPLPQMSAEARQRALADLVCRLVNAPSRRKTLVLVVEDLHWIDEGSEAMLATWSSRSRRRTTLRVVNYRPEYAPAWADAPVYSSIALEPLDQADTRRAAARPRRRRPLARRARRADPRAHPGQPVLHRGDRPRAGRVPATSRASAAPTGWSRPIEDAGVPVTVQAVLAARIDRLDAGGQAAAAGRLGGRQGGQRRGAGADRRARRRTEIDAGAARADRAPASSTKPSSTRERVLAFRHPLTREVAYGTQLAEQPRAAPTRRRRGR